MECKKIQDRLITEYMDQELEAKEDAEVEQHLAACAECRAFFEVVQNKAVAPFKEAVEMQPENAVWQRIQERIEAEGVHSSGGFWKVLDAFISRFPFPVPVMRAAFVTALILTVVVLANWPASYADPVYGYLSEQMTFMSDLKSGNADLWNDDVKDSDASFEAIEGDGTF